MKIPTYIINLKSRTDRYQHILNEFAGKDEFDTMVIEAKSHQNGAIGLWESLKYIIGDLSAPDDDLILICEDDHLFTQDYSAEKLYLMIEDARRLNADVLMGGVSWFDDGVQVADELFWTKKFSGTQFLIIFKKFFKLLLQADFTESDTADAKISSLSDSIYFIAPFISVQKEFGYSDATENNNEAQRVQSLFIRSAIRSKISTNIRAYYSYTKKHQADNADFEDSCISTYVINLTERKERLAHILTEFCDKPEFDVTIVEAIKHGDGGTGLWMSIKKAITLAIKKDDDVVVICEDDHQFSPDYQKSSFFSNILLAGKMGCDYLSGGTGEFDLAVPITDQVFWTNHCLSTQFIIIYRKFYQVILDAPMEEPLMPDIKMSELTVNKMLLVPLISTQKNFGYSDVTQLHNDQPGIVQQMFSTSSHRLMTMQLAYLMHNQDALSLSDKGKLDAFFSTGNP